MAIQPQSKVYTKNNSYAFTAQLLSEPDSINGWLVDEITQADYLLGYATGKTFPDTRDGGYFIELNYTVNSTSWVPDVKKVYVKDIYVYVVTPSSTTKTEKTPATKITKSSSPQYWVWISAGIGLFAVLLFVVSRPKKDTTPKIAPTT
jgi:hypothetical protein